LAEVTDRRYKAIVKVVQSQTPKYV
jgi:hypothetical protein